MYSHLHLYCRVVYVIAGNVLFITQNSARRDDDWTAPAYLIILLSLKTENVCMEMVSLSRFIITVSNKLETFYNISVAAKKFISFIMLVTGRSRSITENIGPAWPLLKLIRPIIYRRKCQNEASLCLARLLIRPTSCTGLKI